MYEVVILTLGNGSRADSQPPVPVLACSDTLKAAGASVDVVATSSGPDSSSAIDAAIARLDGPPRPDGLTWPDLDGKTRLVVAPAASGQVRSVVHRLLRRYAPPPRKRPAELPATRTVPDLPPIGVLPDADGDDLAARLGLPRDPAAVAAAVLAGRIRRLDLLRTDAGSVTLDGALLGATDERGRAVRWLARVEVDDAVLTDGRDPLLACVVANAGGYAELDGLPLVTHPDPADGVVEVAVALPVVTRSLWGRPRVRVEVRRAHGRAASVTPYEQELPYFDDGVAGRLTRRRSWWIEPGAWAVYEG